MLPSKTVRLPLPFPPSFADYVFLYGDTQAGTWTYSSSSPSSKKSFTPVSSDAPSTQSGMRSSSSTYASMRARSSSNCPHPRVLSCPRPRLCQLSGRSIHGPHAEEGPQDRGPCAAHCVETANPRVRRPRQRQEHLLSSSWSWSSGIRIC